MLNKEKLYKYINSVCADPMLRNAVVEYFNTFSKEYKDLYIQRDKFETIKYNGKVVEQDLVKKIFKNRNEISYEELMANLFRRNVKSVRFMYGIEAKRDCSKRGYFAPLSKQIVIRKPDEKIYIERFITEHLGNTLDEKGVKKLKSTKQGKALLANAKQYAKRCVYNEIANVMFHEIGHVFETKRFKGSKIVKVGFRDSFYIHEFRTTFVHKGSEFTTAQMLKYKFEGYTSIRNKKADFISNIYKNGATQIAETFNEVFARHLDGTFCLIEYEPKNTNYTRKTVMPGGCYYNGNVDIFNLITNTFKNINPFLSTQNSTGMIEQINNYKISQDTFNYVKSNLAQELCEIAKKDGFGKAKVYSEINNFVDGLDTYQLLATLIGTSEKQKEMGILDGRNMKVLAHTLILNHYKNDIVEKINNPEIEKDRKFFIEINKDLTLIDENILYPNQTVDCVHNRHTTDLFSVEEFANKFKNEPHICDFADIVEACEFCIEQNRDKMKNIDDITYFFEDQKMLQNKLEMYKESMIRDVANVSVLENQRSVDNHETR